MADQTENIETPVENIVSDLVPENVQEAESSTPISWPFEKTHNCCANLGDVEKNVEFTGIIEFLKRSRVVYALATPTIIYKDIIEDFYRNAKYDFWDNQTIIKSKIQDMEMFLTESDIREALQIKFEVSEDPRELSWTEQKACFLRMKYKGAITDGSMHNGKLSVQFKYFAHVIIHVFGCVSGGYDVMRRSLSSMMVALTLNKPFNVAGMILDHMLEMLKGLKKKQFMLYPRFLMMIFDHKYPELKKDPTMILGQDHMNIRTLVRMKGYKGVPDNEKPPHRRLFGALASQDYTDPGKNRARHDDSDSDNDDPLVYVDASTKRKRQVVNPGAKGKGKGKIDQGSSKQQAVRQKSTAKKGSGLVDEESVDSEETEVDEQWDSDAENVRATKRKATMVGESESLNKSIEEAEKRKKSVIVEDESLGVDLEELNVGETVVVNLPKAKHKTMSKKTSTKQLREKELAQLLKGKRVPDAGTSSKLSSPVAKKHKKSKEAEPISADQLNVALDNVLDMFRKPQKEKEVEPSKSKSKRVTVDDDVMKQVNRKMDDMMKMIVAQQAEIAKFKQNEEKMLQIVVASKSNQDEINEKVKKLEAKNEKLKESVQETRAGL